ncbi:hypothetical protein [Mesoplasma lactucae]|uniref:Uncharacterized protein n=1 Tax=Mesoplasma lactucae ATCC 49193 TaxID=81460 RepID=A0A291IRL1_9MOLU|nr:hypothetical protein [Mesoplasma lactucae]ATG97502.1 hypothetical protein CP520_01910 [Mesoplasma lactucae ATCC 49193]ATZ20042.1 hypothetical protein MLACT_v1c02200 [Mesoplasma lactucae ATCC 49193]MCL8217007.1 hypothetical protein [Mesoplasma lactucae ATCC 49193]
MLKNSKFYTYFSKAIPYLTGMGVGTALSFILTAIPAIRNLKTGYIVLIVLSIAFAALFLSALIFKWAVPAIDASKKYKQYRNSLIDRMLGLSETNDSPEEIKAKSKELKQLIDKAKVDFEKSKKIFRSTTKNAKGASAFAQQIEEKELNDEVA